jgi:hypothetical protein
MADAAHDQIRGPLDHLANLDGEAFAEVDLAAHSVVPHRLATNSDPRPSLASHHQNDDNQQEGERLNRYQNRCQG